MQELLKITKKAPGRARAKVEYYLASKLYCGECGEKLIAVGGTSQNGEQHHYYRCKGKPQCSKKAERKSYLEWYVSEQVLALLNMDGKKDILAQKVIDAYKAGMETDKVSELQRQIRGVEAKLNNVVDLLIERRTDALLKKMDELELQKSELEEQLRVLQDQRRILELTASLLKEAHGDLANRYTRPIRLAYQEYASKIDPTLFEGLSVSHETLNVRFERNGMLRKSENFNSAFFNNIFFAIFN